MKELLDNMQLSSAARAIARKIIEVCENVNDKLQTNLMQLARISQPNRLDKQLLEIRKTAAVYHAAFARNKPGFPYFTAVTDGGRG